MIVFHASNGAISRNGYVLQGAKPTDLMTYQRTGFAHTAPVDRPKWKKLTGSDLKKRISSAKSSLLQRALPDLEVVSSNDRKFCKR